VALRFRPVDGTFYDLFTRSATGLIGGHRNWRDLYAETTFAQNGGEQGIREHEDQVALY